MGRTLGQMTAEIREVNIDKGWRAVNGGGDGRTWGDYIALLHSEVSEALEAYRDWGTEDGTALYCTDIDCPRYGKVATASDCSGKPGRPGHRTKRAGKPEGVGSELADVLIRLLDTCDLFGLNLETDFELGDIASMERPTKLVTFGDHLAWLHGGIHEMGSRRGWVTHEQYAVFALRMLVTVAREYRVKLEDEYERKIAYNRTRPHRHGGRAL